jgi:hypothetical protein
MTKLARQGGVGALESEIGLAVIKRFTIQINDIPFPAFVLRVAAFTVFSLLLIEPAVIPPTLFDILGNVTMVMT